MGRVKRYKKIKACDPCAPKRSEPIYTGGKRKQVDYDLPPEDSDSESARKKRRRQEERWERDALRDDEYIQMLEANAGKKKEKKLEITPRGPNESMKAYRYRIRTETQAALRESFVANSSTKNRRREYMKQRKKMKKAKKAGKEVEDEEEAEGEWARRKGSTKVDLNATNDAPPDLRPFQKLKPGKEGKGGEKEKVVEKRRASESVRAEAIRAYQALKEARANSSKS